MIFLFSFPGMHGNKVVFAQPTHTAYAQLPLHLRYVQCLGSLHLLSVLKKKKDYVITNSILDVFLVLSKIT